jgi:hypothetical protein
MRRMSVTRRPFDDGRVCHEIQGLWLRSFGGDRHQAGFSIQKKEKSKKYSDRLPHGAFLFSLNSLNKFGLVGWSVAYAT